MALTPPQNEALLREIDEAVRQDELVTFWRKYGRILVAVVVLGLAAFGGWLYWQHHQTKAAELHGQQLATLLTAAQRATLDQDSYNALVADGGPGYRAQAELVKAALAAGRGEEKEAIATYDAIIADPTTLPPMKDAALVRRTALAFDEMKPEDVINALKPLSQPGNSWFGSAGELTAIAHMKLNQREEAGKIFAAMSSDAAVPESIRLRAGQMASTLGALTTNNGAAPAANASAQ